MKLKDQICKDRETFKRLDMRQRRWFIWDYYKLPILSVLLVLVFTVTGIMLAVKNTKTVLAVVMINANNEAQSDPFTPLLEADGVDMSGRRVDIESKYTLHYDNETQADAQTIEVLAALFGVGNLDVFVADEPVYDSYAGQKAFLNLSLFLPADLLKAHSGDLYYGETASGRGVCGIRLHPGSPLHTSGYYAGDVIIGVAASAQNMDNALAAVRELLREVA